MGETPKPDDDPSPPTQQEPNDDEFDDRPRDCSWCGGDGLTECDGSDCYCSNLHDCPACRGSGDAKDQTLW
jgi:hypothetical protein